MAHDKRKGFSKIAPINWFTLREKFKQRVPAEVSNSYVASSLSMSEGSARSNVIAPLKALGIVTEDGKPSELAYDWRDDTKYKDVCNSIVQTVYPQELHDLFHQPDTPVDQLIPWFMRTAKVGEPAARMYAQTYLMLLEADPAKGSELVNARTATKADSPKRSRTSNRSNADQRIGTAVEASDAEGSKSEVRSDTTTSSLKPRLHIDIQIHISPESGAEQIDKIFESMAKHLKDFKR